MNFLLCCILQTLISSAITIEEIRQESRGIFQFFSSTTLPQRAIRRNALHRQEQFLSSTVEQESNGILSPTTSTINHHGEARTGYFTDPPGSYAEAVIQQCQPN
eukprot:scaffold1813_cov109-Cylindrotheca_fusiformis.AAC.10